MKIEFIKRGAATRLILIFAGWSTDARYYNDCLFDGWDTAVVSDYRDLKMPPIPEQYSTVYLFAYSLGVFASSVVALPAAVRIAVCGTPMPVSDIYGIPCEVYKGTLDRLNERQLDKFHLRMAGDRSAYERLKTRLPEYTDISHLKEELAAIDANWTQADYSYAYDRVYIAVDDRIFPYSSVSAYWERFPNADRVLLKSPHAVGMAAVIREVIPNTKAIGEGFERANATYNETAVVQSEICRRMGDMIGKFAHHCVGACDSLLEIGVGQGLLTDVWRKSFLPRCATYIDLHEMPRFGIAEEEKYVIADAEGWLENSQECFDVILSSSTIQWFADPVKFISTVRNHLKPGGIAVVSTFVKGNLWQLDKVRPSPIVYKNVSDYLSAGDCIGDWWSRTLRFSSSKGMMMHLRKTGVSQKGNRGLDSIKMGSSVKDLSKLPCELTYMPLIIFIKN